MKKVRLVFECNQDWDAMPCEENGRFCAICQKTVVDFSRMLYSDIRKAAKKNPELCGSFDPAQLQGTVITPLKNPFYRPFFAWATVFSLGMFTPAKTSAIPVKPTSELVSGQFSSIQKSAMTKAEFVSVTGAEKIPNGPHVLFKTKKKIYYLTWRFPFVHGVLRYPKRTMGVVRFL